MQAVSSGVNELQLGTRLNQAISSNSRGEFALLLSLLSADLRDMAQFQTAEFVQADLRVKFDLGTVQPLLATLDHKTEVIEHSASFRQGGSVAFRLENALRTEAFVIRRDEPLEMEDVMANCDLNTRHRHKSAHRTPMIKSIDFVEQLQQQQQMSQLIAQA